MASIQFNLLPDVKEQYINTERSRRLVITIAFLATAVSVAIFLLVLFTVDVVQKKELSDTSAQANQAASQLQKINGISRIATVQNQLQTLATLHQNTHAVSRIFQYMPQLTPAAASIGNLIVDLSANSLQVSGNADTQATVNAFVDTLKFATFRANAQDSDHLAFSAVVLSSFGVTPGKASFSITAQFDPSLFMNPLGARPVLTVKNQVTTRSNDPASVLFNSGGSK
jgi:Tfp pilus assembly protein PilN